MPWDQQRRNWMSWAHLIPEMPPEVLWKDGEEYHYKLAELRAMPPAHREVILNICESRYQDDAVLDQSWFNALTEEELNDELLQLWRPCKGCAPASEIGDNLLETVTSKFFIPLQVACGMAEVLWERKQGRKKLRLFQPFPIVQPSYEDVTYFAILDFNLPVRYLLEREKAWSFKWASMTAFANWVLARALRTVQMFEFECARSVRSRKK